MFLPNPRGGRGHGHAFAARVAGAVGIDEWTDVLSGIDLLIADGVADPDRLGIGGWSHGGFMAAWAVGQTDRFKAALMGAGISDWGMLAATGEEGPFEAALGGSTGWEGTGPHHHDLLSPISFASKISTPVLILHGENDTNVPLAQAKFFHRALRRFGVEHEYVVYPRENHSIRERNHQLDLLRRTREWFDRWLMPPSGRVVELTRTHTESDGVRLGPSHADSRRSRLAGFLLLASSKPSPRSTAQYPAAEKMERILSPRFSCRSSPLGRRISCADIPIPWPQLHRTDDVRTDQEVRRSRRRTQPVPWTCVPADRSERPACASTAYSRNISAVLEPSYTGRPFASVTWFSPPDGWFSQGSGCLAARTAACPMSSASRRGPTSRRCSRLRPGMRGRGHLPLRTTPTWLPALENSSARSAYSPPTAPGPFFTRAGTITTAST